MSHFGDEMNIIQTTWDGIIQNKTIDDRTFFTIGSWLSPTLTFWTLNGLLWMVHKYKWFPKYKIQGPEAYPNWELVKDCLKHMVVNHLVGRPIVFYLSYTFFIYFGMDMCAPIPSLFTIICQLAFFIMVNDTMFYWSHRLLHHRYIYKYVHKKHHMFKASIGLASEYAHPIEDMLSNGIPVLIGPILIGAHPVVYWIWLSIRVWEAVDSHSGYNFPHSPWTMFPSIQGGAERHDYHHSHNVGNFGSFFIFWDWFMNTDKSYILWKQKQNKIN